MMNKHIAFIIFDHFGSTIPLAEYLVNEGYNIDYYMECFENKVENIEATDIELLKFFRIKGKLASNDSIVMNKYCRNILFYYLRLIRPMSSYKFLRYISNFINRILIRHICLDLNKKKYDSVILVGRYQVDHFVYFHKFLKCKIITCLHEVCNHFNPDFAAPSPLLKFLFENKKEIVIHSKKSRVDINKYMQCDDSNIHKICFGLFETWKFVNHNNRILSQVGVGYVLFIGMIDEYKGLDVLCGAIRKLRDLGNNKIKFVIAGSGCVSSIKNIVDLDNVIVINKFLSNEEFASLMFNSHCVICPYKTMSQSGIPQSSFVFKKPVIASDLEGFNEIIKDQVNGLLCKSGDIDSFVEAILKTYDVDLYKKMVLNIQHFSETNPEYNWNVILKQYIKLIYSNE